MSAFFHGFVPCSFCLGSVVSKANGVHRTNDLQCTHEVCTLCHRSLQLNALIPPNLSKLYCKSVLLFNGDYLVCTNCNISTFQSQDCLHHHFVKYCQNIFKCPECNYSISSNWPAKLPKLPNFDVLISDHVNGECARLINLLDLCNFLPLL